jgi:DNA-binding transcriptional LysR family regulator
MGFSFRSPWVRAISNTNAMEMRYATGITMIELRQFRQFVAVAEELSFRRAAERLHMAQPPLTAAIRRIEEELGQVLIERSNRVERLTPAGEVFLIEARRAGQGLTGSLRVTFVASAARDLLPSILRAFRARHADVALELHEATTAQQVTALREDRADIGIVVVPLPEAAQLTVARLRREELLVALPRRHRLASRQVLRLADLASESWILFPAGFGPGLHARIVDACRVAGFSPRVTQEAVQMETIVSLVAAGMGVSLVPPAMAKPRRSDVRFVRVTGAGSPVRYELALAYARPSPLVEAFARSAATASATEE